MSPLRKPLEMQRSRVEVWFRGKWLEVGEVAVPRLYYGTNSGVPSHVSKVRPASQSAPQRRQKPAGTP